MTRPQAVIRAAGKQLRPVFSSKMKSKTVTTPIFSDLYIQACLDHHMCNAEFTQLDLSIKGAGGPSLPKLSAMPVTTGLSGTYLILGSYGPLDTKNAPRDHLFERSSRGCTGAHVTPHT